MRKRLLWFVTLLALLAPVIALGVRWNEQRNGSRLLATGLALLETPIERAATLEAVDVAAAQRAFDAARRGDPAGDTGRRARALWHVAQAYADLSRGDPSLALQEADVALRLAPGEPHAHLAVAEVAARRGERARAERALDALGAPGGAAGARVPEHVAPAVAARAARLRADLLLDAGRAHDALGLLEALDRLHPRAATVANALGLARAAVGDAEGARGAFERATALDPRDVSPRVNLARLLREQGALPAAREALEQALAVEPERAEAWLAYGVVLSELEGREHASTARHALVRAAHLAPEDAAPLVAQGMLDLAEGNVNGAIESFRAALARDADDATARTNLGVALARQGQRAAAAEAFEQATRRAPHQGEAWNGLGAMRLALGDLEGAVGALAQACVLLPADPNPALNLGRAYERLARWDDAARAFREALRRAPGHPSATEHLARMVPAAAAGAGATPGAAARGQTARGHVARDVPERAG